MTRKSIEKILTRNDQRGDLPTMFWKTPGHSQCMGNAYQNILNWWLDRQHQAMTKFTTEEYYSRFEWYLKNVRGKSVLNQIMNKFSEYHNDFLNSIFSGSITSPERIELVSRADKKDIINALEKKLPVNAGTTLTGAGGHIVTLMSYDQKTDLFSVSDPWGDANTKYISANGFNVKYSFEQMKIRHYSKIIELV